MKTRTLTAAGAIASAAAGFGLCGWSLVEDARAGQAAYEQAAATYGPPAILNYLTDDPDGVWATG